METMEIQYAIGFAHGQGKTEFRDIYIVVASKARDNWPVNQATVRRLISEIDEASKRRARESKDAQLRHSCFPWPHDL